MKVEVDSDELKEILYLVNRAHIKQMYCEYYEVLDLLYEIKERLEELVGGEDAEE
ncbi:MAG: hypothetical protein J7J61_06975 [Candidatus Hydrothermae bacterium]|nr:hypothetical protein [Candidatus Hydrothermae bacterium]